MGHRSQFILVEDGVISASYDRDMQDRPYFPAFNIPLYVAQGPEFISDWLQRQKMPRLENAALFDEVFTEAAIMLNLDHKEMIFGFWQWLPEKNPETVGEWLFDFETQDFMTEFLDCPDVTKIFFDIIKPIWSSWTVEAALPAEFAVPESIKTRVAELSHPIIRDVKAAPSSGQPETLVRNLFSQAFSIGLGQTSQAFRRLSL